MIPCQWAEVVNAALNTAQIVTLAWIAAKFGARERMFRDDENEKNK